MTNTAFIPHYKRDFLINNKELSEVWYLKLVDPEQKIALWLRFTVLITRQGQQKIAETWGIFFEQPRQNKTKKQAFKFTQSLDAFYYNHDNQHPLIAIDSCKLSDQHTEGSIHNNQNTLKWNLTYHARTSLNFNFVPELLSKWHLTKNQVVTTHEDILFTGTCYLNQKKYEFKNAPGMIGHYSGPQSGHSWLWAHCNTFVDETGTPSPTVFDGIRVRAKIHKWPSPYITSLFFYYNNKAYPLNTCQDMWHHTSAHNETEWKFSARKGPLLFAGHIEAEPSAFAGLTYTDTDNSHLYCYNAKLANMTLQIYYEGILEQTLYARQSAAFETVVRTPYKHIPLIL